jgi:hypothetical protein
MQQYDLTRAGISVARCVPFLRDDDGPSVPEIVLAPCNSSVDAANGGFAETIFSARQLGDETTGKSDKQQRLTSSTAGGAVRS